MVNRISYHSMDALQLLLLVIQFRLMRTLQKPMAFVASGMEFFQGFALRTSEFATEICASAQRQRPGSINPAKLCDSCPTSAVTQLWRREPET